MTATHDMRAERRWASIQVDDLLSGWAKGAIAHAGDPGGAGDPADTIVFGGGIPDPPTLPREELLAAARRVLEKDGPGALRYGGNQGDLLMRAWLAERLNDQEGAGVGPEHFVLTNGSGQAIQMCVTAFADAGDTILVERPSYSGALRAFRAYGLRMAAIEMDGEGVRLNALAQTLDRLFAEGRTPRFFYTMPTFHNPTGLTTSLPRREAVAGLLDRYGVLIVEDDAYGEIRCEGAPIPSYFRLTGGDGALRLSTVSKMLATGLRVGWITGRQDMIDALTRLRFDGGLSPFLLRTVAEFCASGDQDRHLAKMIPIYREKRDRMVTALAERCGQRVTWTTPEGGYFLWLKLADGIDPAALAAAMAAERVVARPGVQFFPDSDDHAYIRLCFSNPSPAEIDEGIRRLGRALDRCAV
jgi:DNA-binding transcriptional MocR family regulator